MPKSELVIRPRSRLRLYAFLNDVAARLSWLGLRHVPFVSKLRHRLTDWIAPKGVHPVRVLGHTMYVDVADVGVARSLLAHGLYESYETELFEKSLRPGQRIVDIGANVGYYTLIAARAVGEGGEVVAFEPEPKNRALLERNVALNGYRNVVIVPAGVAAESGKITLYTDEDNLAAASIAEANLPVKREGRVDIDVVALDDYFASRPSIDLIKMDTQGSEGLICEGADSILRSSGPILVMEFWPFGLRNVGTDPRALLGTLVGMGYRLLTIDERHRSLDERAPDAIIHECESRRDGRAHVNLLCRRS